MFDDGATTRSGETGAADPERVRMTWAVEVGPGRGLIARWDTTDERRRCLDRPCRRTAA